MAINEMQSERALGVIRLRRLPLFTILTGASLTIGLLVPTVFEWTKQESARSRHPEMEFAALVAMLTSLSIAVVIWIRNRPDTCPPDRDEHGTANRIQFGIRHVLIATTLVAMTLAVAPIFDELTAVLYWFLVEVLVVISVWTCFQSAAVRSRMGAILASLFLPFAWIIPCSKPFGHASGLLSALAFGPGLLPAALARRGNIGESTWIAMLFVMLEMGVAIWLARRGGKLALIYTFLVLCLSTLTSFGLHALYRM